MRLAKPASIVFPVLAAWCAAACGGAFEGGDNGGSGGTAGGASAGKGGQATAGSGGSSAGGGSGVGSGGSCFWNGMAYDVGDTFPTADGCNTCSCIESGVVCTQLPCADQCSELQNAYTSALEAAKSCEPGTDNSCSQPLSVGLVCGCESFVNPEQTEAIALLEQLRQQYAEASCAEGLLCGPCLPPTSAFCSSEGLCVDVLPEVNDAACKVGGVVYPNGSSNVPDPFSCNTCQCIEGQLVCTEIDCPVACPPNAVPSSQCAQCAPNDDCDVVEHACLPVCSDACESGACIDGVCRSFCG